MAAIAACSLDGTTPVQNARYVATLSGGRQRDFHADGKNCDYTISASAFTTTLTAYVNLHTAAFPGGEIRGQIVRQ